ncbi:MAG: hypothetical protein COV44_10740 [Deltaproteobacteria bacterium CG11_big_fil_rev_8_21_14_0_20_45_16]|nr:MAG: hypothetical protein COV44_10740 [Deltaproteobacteria bacterium CG11_big_fil_rev_8_21_14_0_20_45_16]
MKNWKKYLKSEYRHENHAAPLSRRDFLARGLMASLGAVIAPSIESILSGRLLYGQGLNCPTYPTNPSPMIPFLQLDHAGGAAFGGDFICGGQGGQLDFLTASGDSTDYENFGYPSDLHPSNVTPDTSFGVAFHANSPFLMGLKSALPSQYWNSVDGGIVASATDSDTQANPLGMLQYIPLVDRYGTVVPSVGSTLNASGGNNTLAPDPIGGYSALSRPSRVSSATEAAKLTGYIDLMTTFGEPIAERVLKAIGELNSSQLLNFKNMNIPDQIEALHKCGYLRAKDLPFSVPPEDLFKADEAELLDSFGADFNDSVHTKALAPISYLLSKGYVGAGCVSVGGFDNHNGNSKEPNAIRYRAGFAAGLTIKYFASKGMPLFIAGITDGYMGVKRVSGVLQIDNTDPSGTVNTLGYQPGGLGTASRPGDSNIVGCQWFLAYVPGKARGDLVQNSGRQIGAFSTKGVVLNYLQTANAPGKVAQAILYQYLLLQGLGPKINLVLGSNNFLDDAPEYQILKKAWDV